MKKILFIMHTPPPVHGAAMVGKYIKESKLINDSFDCHYINLTTAASLQDIGKLSLGKIKRIFALLISIRKAIKTFRPDLVYMTPNSKGGAFMKDFLTMMVIKVCHKNIVIHFHNKGVKKYQDKPLYNFLYRRFFKGLKVILLAEPLYVDIEKYVDRKNVLFCPNGIPFVPASSIGKKHNNDAPRLLFLSNMMEAKGVWTLVDACKILRDKGIVFYCDFVGKWSDISEENFKQHIQKYDLADCIKAHGGKYGEVKNEFFKLADIFVYPTYEDCFPLTILEAMSFGLPCITSNEGAIPEIIDNEENGFVIPMKDANLLAKRIEYLIENKDIRTQLANNTFTKFKKEYTLSAFEVKFKDILLKCV